MKKNMEILMDEIHRLTMADIEDGHGKNFLFRALIKEAAEFAEADDVESGLRQKEITESSSCEAVDVVICALGLFYSVGGTNEQLANYGMEKLAKWETNRKLRKEAEANDRKNTC